MANIPPIRGVIAFEAIVRHASFSKAAEELNLTPSAVSHQVASLEDYVGCALFERTSRGANLTPAGERFQRNLAGALGLINSAADSARQDKGDEVLRIHSAPSFATLWLMPRLQDFIITNPGIQIGLSTSLNSSDFLQGEVDLDIRYGATCWPDLHVEPIFADEITPMISPKMLERVHIARPEDLLAQNLILSEGTFVQWPQWFATHRIRVSPTQYSLSFDRTYMVLEAAAQGWGIALDSTRLAEQMLHRGQLVRVFPNEKGISLYAYHLVYPHTHGARSTVARFVAWLSKQVAMYQR
jgi:LysR family glycine cleavage system transcriptional activator